MENKEVATFAGGCFWCTEAVFKRLKGVHSVLPGYAGGTTEDPTYDEVCGGKTGHAEVIQISFVPEQIPFSKLLDIFFHTHNPTTLNQQGNDMGTQYRSSIFYHNEEQKVTSEKAIEELEKSKVFSDPVVTEIVPFTKFYEAESYHKDYFDRNKEKSYCDFVITPKIQKLLKDYSSDVKDEFKEL